jgi:hypothetical protein
MTVSDYLANAILDKILRGVDFVTANVYVSLHRADPGLTGTAECIGGSYSRQQVSTAGWAAAGSRLSSNLNAVQWLAMPSAALSYVGLWDSPSNGNFLIGGPMTSPATLILSAAGDTFQYNINTLRVTFL